MKPRGKVVIRLCNDIVDWMKGADEVAEAMAKELGITVGETTADGAITLTRTPCIGMSDQAPAALINDTVVTNLSPERARHVAHELRKTLDPSQLVTMTGDGNNSHPLVRSMVRNNIRRRGPVLFAAFTPGSALEAIGAKSPDQVIADIRESRLRGRGGAGFATGLKWEFARRAPGDARYVICNADEGEPGTFKDRVLLTECANQMFEGMTIAGYALGSGSGIVYLRGEYKYLRPLLESVLEERRKAGLLGKSILDRPGVDFDIRIQLGPLGTNGGAPALGRGHPRPPRRPGPAGRRSRGLRPAPGGNGRPRRGAAWHALPPLPCGPRRPCHHVQPHRLDDPQQRTDEPGRDEGPCRRPAPWRWRKPASAANPKPGFSASAPPTSRPSRRD